MSSTDTSVRMCDVAIVGAGLAGLRAARELARRDVDVLVLEASDRVGGRVRQEALGPRWPGAGVEAGGQWIGPRHPRMLALVADLGLRTFPTYDEGANLFEWRGELRRYSGAYPSLGVVASADIAQAVLRLERMSLAVPVAEPWRAAKAAQWDAQTLWSWTRRNVPTRVGRAFVTLVCEAVWAADPGDLSLLHFLAYARSGGGLEALISTEGGAQELRVVGGTQQLADRMASALGDRVVLGQVVRAIEHDAEGVVGRDDDVEVRARRVVVAVPPPIAGRIAYAPGLPASRDQLTQRLTMGSVVKCHAVYDEPFWRADGLSGQVTSGDGPVKVVFDNSPPSGEPGVLVAFYEGGQARRATAMGAGERRQRTLDALARFLGPGARRPEHYTDTAWTEQEHIRGCYAAFAPPGVLTSCGPALRHPIGPIHWAGTETATGFGGYMEGALESGDRVAVEVRAALGEG